MTLENQIENLQKTIIILTKEYKIDLSFKRYLIIQRYKGKLAELQREYSKQLRHETN